MKIEDDRHFLHFPVSASCYKVHYVKRSESRNPRTLPASVIIARRKTRKDRTVVAAILFGSLSYDEVWKNSDIDLWLIMEDGQKEGEVTLCEYDVNIHAQRIPRGRFKRSIEGDLAADGSTSVFPRVPSYSPKTIRSHNGIAQSTASARAIKRFN